MKTIRRSLKEYEAVVSKLSDAIEQFSDHMSDPPEPVLDMIVLLHRFKSGKILETDSWVSPVSRLRVQRDRHKSLQHILEEELLAIDVDKNPCVNDLIKRCKDRARSLGFPRVLERKKHGMD